LDPRQNPQVIAHELARENFELGNKSTAIDPMTRALETVSPAEARAILSRALASTDPQEVRNAVQVANQLSPFDRGLYLDALPRLPRANRLAIFEKADRIGDLDDLLAIVAAGLRDTDPQIRVTAARAVGYKFYGVPQVRAFFSRVLAEHRDPQIQAVARNVLGMPDPHPTMPPPPPPSRPAGAPKPD
jgi:hypothetical protein